MKFFNYDSPFWSALSRIADLVILNLLWLVFCLPVFTIGASTAAMYRVTLNMVRDTGGGVVRSFWDAFKLNFRQGVFLFLILLIPIALVCYELFIYASGMITQSVWMGIVFCCPALLIALVASYVYPLLAQFDNTIKNTLKNSCLLAIANLPYSLLMAVLNLSALLLFIFAPTFFLQTSIFWILIGGSSIALLNSYFLRKIFKKCFDLD